MRKLYWTIEQFPELEHLSETQRRKLLSWRMKLKLYPSAILTSLVVGLVPVVVMGSLLSIFVRGDALEAAALAIWLVSSVGAYGLLLSSVRRSMRREIAQHLRRDEWPMCPSCGYARPKQVDSDTCPECGAEWL